MTPTIRVKGLEVLVESLKKQTFRDFEFLVDINVTGQVDFNQAMNRLIKRAKGELIVSIQDYIKVPPDGLQQFWDAYQHNPQFYTAPVGKTLDWESVTWDWRKHRKDSCNWMEWEIDYGCAPREALVKIGGFDESLDEYWGFDNCIAGLSAEMAGYKIINLPDNCAVALDHNQLEPHPFIHLRNPDYYNYRLQQIRMGLKLDYLRDNV